MIGANQILKLAKAGKPLHCVTVDYGEDFASKFPPEMLAAGLTRYSVSHYATKAQAEKEMQSAFTEIPRSYSTRLVTPEEERQAREDFFFILI